MSNSATYAPMWVILGVGVKSGMKYQCAKLEIGQRRPRSNFDQANNNFHIAVSSNGRYLLSIVIYFKMYMI